LFQYDQCYITSETEWTYKPIIQPINDIIMLPSKTFDPVSLFMDSGA